MKIKKGHKVIINDEIMQGNPSMIESMLKVGLANDLLKMAGNDYENICDNLRKMADVFELLEEHINDEYITLKYNPMGSWYIKEDEEND